RFFPYCSIGILLRPSLVTLRSHSPQLKWITAHFWPASQLSISSMALSLAPFCLARFTRTTSAVFLSASLTSGKYPPAIESPIKRTRGRVDVSWAASTASTGIASDNPRMHHQTEFIRIQAPERKTGENPAGPSPVEVLADRAPLEGVAEPEL